MKFAPVLLFLMLIFSLIWQSFVNQVWLEMAIQGLRWRGTLAPINLKRFEEKLCVEYEALRGAYCENGDGESWDTEMPHTAGTRGLSISALWNFSLFTNNPVNYELRTADLQVLDLSLSWAPLELSRVMGTQSGSGIQRKNIGTALAWPGDVRTWGLSPYIKCGLLTTLSHCATPGHSRGLLLQRPLCREWAHLRVGWTGRDQPARNRVTPLTLPQWPELEEETQSPQDMNWEFQNPIKSFAWI